MWWERYTSSHPSMCQSLRMLPSESEECSKLWASVSSPMGGKGTSKARVLISILIVKDIDVKRRGTIGEATTDASSEGSISLFWERTSPIEWATIIEGWHEHLNKLLDP